MEDDDNSMRLIVPDPSFYKEKKSSKPDVQRPLYALLVDNLITDTPTILEQLEIEKSHSDQEFRLYHVKSFQQKNLHNCGYHSLYSGQVLYEMITSTDEQNLLPHLYSKKCFWSYFDKIGETLLEECKRKCALNNGKERFPWERKNILSGIIERSYMNFLLKDKSVEEDAIYQIPDVSPALLAEDPGLFLPEKIKEISKKFDLFFRSPRACVVFLIGTLQHWFDVVANKYDDGKVEFIVISSSNSTYFGLTEEEMKKQMETKIDEYIKKHPEDAPMRNFMVRRHQRSIQQTRKIVKMITKCCIGQTTFIQFYVDRGLKGILNEYYRHEKEKRVWGFLDEFPPRQMEDGIMKVLENFGDYVDKSKHFDNIKVWVRDIKEEIELLERGGDHLSERKKSNLGRLKILVLEMEGNYLK